ncbi:MAG: crotonase/enoyl-CoA hydratase family protein, partial [Pseudomonadota bacterium]
DETLRLETDADGVARVTLARPERHNALDSALIGALATAAAQLARDGAVRAVVLTGEGESFCAGADLGWMRAQMGADRARRIAEATALAETLRALDTLPKPLIARVNGQAYGGGLGLMSVADLAIAARPGRFAFTEVRLGLTPATISPYVVRRMGEPRAREVFFSGRFFDADEAVRLGLAASAVARDALDEAVTGAIAPYLSAAPGAVADAKALVARQAGGVDSETIRATAEALADRWETAEAREGIAAFFEKRRPSWRQNGSGRG